MTPTPTPIPVAPGLALVGGGQGGKRSAPVDPAGGGSAMNSIGVLAIGSARAPLGPCGPDPSSVEEQNRFLRAVIDAVPYPVLVIGTDRKLRLANAAASRSYALRESTPPGGSDTCCHQILERCPLPCGADEAICPLDLALASGTSVSTIHRHQVGEAERYLEIIASPYRGPDERMAGVVEVSRDITEEMVAQERVRFLAYQDMLTGLPNRVLLRERFAEALQAGHGQEAARVGLLYLDLDDFKRVNDRLGHQVGDLVLQEVARRLTAAVRKTDTVSRQGGDEFLVLLPGLNEVGEARRVAEHIAAALDPPIRVDGYLLRATFSIGIALLPGDGEDFDSLLTSADLAMYAAKAAGRNTIRSYSRKLRRRAFG